MKKKIIVVFGSLLFLGAGVFLAKNKDVLRKKVRTHSTKNSFRLGDKIDSLNGVYVYYNDNVKNVSGRNLAPDGYNIGLKYQCVEFVKRFYYEHLNHKMPNSYGHAKDFYNHSLKDGTPNRDRNLIQYSNGSRTKPKVNDLLIFDKTAFNPYGHVAIISKVTDNKVEIIQQNPGPFISSRETFKLTKKDNKWHIHQGKILGWLRKE